MSAPVNITSYRSPAGTLWLGSARGCLCLCDWQAPAAGNAVWRRISRHIGGTAVDGAGEVTELATRQLDEYFAGTRRAFDIPLLMCGTDFQQAVWQALAAVPYGTTTSYGAIARQIGRPSAVRAVAAAIGANALSVILPCHRIIGTDGTLIGYRGGLPAKHHLLRHESKLLQDNTDLMSGTVHREGGDLEEVKSMS